MAKVSERMEHGHDPISGIEVSRCVMNVKPDDGPAVRADHLAQTDSEAHQRCVDDIWGQLSGRASKAK